VSPTTPVPGQLHLELGAVTPPDVRETRREHLQSPEIEPPQSGALSPDESGFAPGVPKPVKSRLMELMGKPSLTPEEIKHDEYLAKRRDQWRRRKERKDLEALERDRD
jgi:hypothetical protein